MFVCMYVSAHVCMCMYVNPHTYIHTYINRREKVRAHKDLIENEKTRERTRELARKDGGATHSTAATNGQTEPNKEKAQAAKE